uniref:Uncharacterized protein n=1 Tax=Cacopsylla melanoneura TaxID=428564 RepID=A0A8D9E6F5_9HEMI
MSPLIIFNNKESIITTVIIFQVTMETLKRSWENFKASTKRKLTTEKQMRLLTGGSSYHPSPHSSPTPDLDSLLQKNLDIEIKHFKDSDGIQLQKMAQSTVLATTSSDIEDDPEIQTSPNQIEDSHIPSEFSVATNQPGPSIPTHRPTRSVRQNNSSSYYLTRASCLTDEKDERLRRIQLSIDDERAYHKQRMLVLQEEQKYWQAKQSTEDAQKDYWVMKKHLEEKKSSGSIECIWGKQQ